MYVICSLYLSSLFFLSFFLFSFFFSFFFWTTLLFSLQLLRRMHIYHTKKVVPESFRSNMKACLQSVFTGEGEEKHVALNWNAVSNDIQLARQKILKDNAAAAVDKSAKGNHLSLSFLAYTFSLPLSLSPLYLFIFFPAHLMVASLVLATYQVLSKQLEGNHQLVTEILTHCFCKVGVFILLYPPLSSSNLSFYLIIFN